jgi:hypothetical protein
LHEGHKHLHSFNSADLGAGDLIFCLHARISAREIAVENHRPKENGTKLTRRDFLKSTSALGAAPLAAWSEAGRTKANVILIISDQFRWDWIGANGLNPLNLTPHIDRMGREGVNFGLGDNSDRGERR